MVNVNLHAPQDMRILLLMNVNPLARMEDMVIQLQINVFKFVLLDIIGMRLVIV